VNIAEGAGGGSPRMKFDFGSSSAVTVNCGTTGQSAEQGVPALLLKGNNVGNVLNATQGSIGLAFDQGSTAQWPTIRIGSEDSKASDVSLICGAGCTLGTIQQAGGDCRVSSNVTTLTMTDGTYHHLAGTMGTLTQDGGTLYYQSTGSLTSGTVRNRGTKFDCSRDRRARTFTNFTVIKGAELLDPHQTITFSNAFATDRDSLAQMDLGPAFNLQRS
jgi:hypothetical protein